MPEPAAANNATVDDGQVLFAYCPSATGDDQEIVIWHYRHGTFFNASHTTPMAYITPFGVVHNNLENATIFFLGRRPPGGYIYFSLPGNDGNIQSGSFNMEYDFSPIIPTVSLPNSEEAR